MLKILTLLCSVILSGCGVYAQQQNLAALNKAPIGTPKEELASQLSGLGGNAPCGKVGILDGDIIELCGCVLTFDPKASSENGVFFHKGKYVGKGNGSVFLEGYQKNHQLDQAKASILIIRTYGGKSKTEEFWSIPKGFNAFLDIKVDGHLVGELYHDSSVLFDHDPGEVQIVAEQNGKEVGKIKLAVEKNKSYTIRWDYKTGIVSLDGDESGKIIITSNPPGALAFAGRSENHLASLGKTTPYTLSRRSKGNSWANEYYQVRLDGYKPSPVVFKDNSFGDRIIHFELDKTELAGLEKIEFDFAEESKEYQNRKELYLASKDEYTKKELSFLNELENKQLELYSAYTDHINGNSANIAKVILSFREFTGSLDENKKDEFVKLYSDMQHIKIDTDLLEKMNQNLIDRKKSIDDLKASAAEAEKRAKAEEQQAKEASLRNQQMMIATQNAQAAQAEQNTLGMLTILTAGINTFSSIESAKYNAQANAYRQYSDQYESDRRNRELVNSIKGVEDSITKTRRGQY